MIYLYQIYFKKYMKIFCIIISIFPLIKLCLHIWVFLFSFLLFLLISSLSMIAFFIQKIGKKRIRESK